MKVSNMIRLDHDASEVANSPACLTGDTILSWDGPTGVRGALRPESERDGRASESQALRAEIAERQRAEAALRESERLFRDMMNRIKLISLMLDGRGRITYCNDYLLTLTGWRREDVIGQSWFDLFIPSNIADVKGVFENLLKDLPEAWHHENEILTKPGGRRLIRWNNSVLRSASSEVIGTASIGEDITERKMAEEQLGESEERFRQMAERIDKVFWMCDKDMTRVLYVSPAYEQIWGRPCSTLYERLASFAEAALAEDRDQLMAAIAAKKQGRETEVQYRISRPDGSVRWILARSFPVRNEAGEFYRIAGVCEDITERKKSEESLRESQERLTLATESASIGIWEWDLATNSLVWDRQMYKLYGVPEAGFSEGYDFWQKGVHPEDRNRAEEELAAALDGRGDFHTEFRVVWPNGEVHDIEAHGLVQRDGTRASIRMIGVNWDITERKRAVNALQESEERFRGVFNSAGTGIATSTPEGRFLQANAAYCKMLGYTEAELQERNFASVTHPDDLALNLQMRDEVLAGTRSRFVMEKRYIRKNGDFVWTRHSVASVRGGRGEVVMMIVVAEDITERMAAERQSVEQMKLMEMASSVAKLGAWAIEYPGPKIVWSKEVYRIHEVEPDLKPDLETALSFFPPASRDRLKQAILSEQPYDLELDFITAKGKKLRTRTTSAVEKQNGAIRRFFGIFQDVTDQNRTAARFRRLVESNAQGVIFFDVHGKITEANDAFLSIVGFSREDLASGELDWPALTPPEYAALDRRALEQLAAKGTCMPYEKEYVRKDGSRVPILLGSAVFEDNKDEGVCFVLDLTESKKIERQFLRSQRMESIGTLAGGIAHDMNNILAPIMMSLEYLKSTNTDESNSNLLDTVQKSAERGADLVKQLLSFARGVEGQRVAVDLVHIIKELLKVMKDTFPKDINSSFKAGANLWRVIGDPTQLHQIFLNLCVNARDAMPGGGSLSVRLENVVVDETFAAMNPGANPGSYVKTQVEDTGTGIPVEIRERIFEPFFTTKDKGKGTGLGLSSTMAIIKSHGGFINLESEMGKGTRFDVYLPADTSGKTPEEAAAQPKLQRGHGEMVLVVDDEEAILTVTSETLQRFGYRVLLAKHGAEAVALYAQHHREIAVVLTDMLMPIMDGPALIVALKAMNPQVLIIGSSGRASQHGVTKALTAGVRFFVPKPYTAETMLETLQKALHGESAK
jgi:PAS domain S-box-containing protein